MSGGQGPSGPSSGDQGPSGPSSGDTVAAGFVPVDIGLDGLAFADARTGRPLVPGDGAGPGVLTVIRHRY